MCIGINVEEGSSFEVCHLEKKTKYSYKGVQHLTHSSELPYMDCIMVRLEVLPTLNNQEWFRRIIGIMEFLII